MGQAESTAVMPLVAARVTAPGSGLPPQAAAAGAGRSELSDRLVARSLATLTFATGTVLLLWGATPAAAGRLGVIAGIRPLAVIELSHFAGSIIGAALLVLAHGLWRRLDAAYLLTLVLTGCGIGASLLEGVHYEKAALLSALLVVLWWSRPAFSRRTAFLEARFSARWTAAVISAAAASVWLGFFSFKHVEYSSQLWWQFELHGEASRFLRASVGAATALLLFATARLVHHAPHRVRRPNSAAIDCARDIVRAHGLPLSNLVYLRDKGVLFNDERDAFLMYGVRGRTWAVLGDPVGPAERIASLIRLFLERCDDFGGVPAFYGIRPECLHYYADFGFTAVKLGEEACVDLAAFTLEGGKARRLRQVVRRLDQDGGRFRIVPASDVPLILGDLRRVSDDWLLHKAGAEKGFSLGFFDDEYLARFAVAVVEHGGRIQAFANLLVDTKGATVSFDLMRYHHSAPRNAMEALFVHTMVWARAQGYGSFTLGMAPLSGFESSPVATLWSRLGSFVYDHGGRFYNFQGLRGYKQKFDPVWEPRYLAYRGGLQLPRILVDLSALIAGGYGRIFARAPDL